MPVEYGEPSSQNKHKCGRYRNGKSKFKHSSAGGRIGIHVRCQQAAARTESDKDAYKKLIQDFNDENLIYKGSLSILDTGGILTLQKSDDLVLNDLDYMQEIKL